MRITIHADHCARRIGFKLNGWLSFVAVWQRQAGAFLRFLGLAVAGDLHWASQRVVSGVELLNDGLGAFFLRLLLLIRGQGASWGHGESHNRELFTAKALA